MHKPDTPTDCVQTIRDYGAFDRSSYRAPCSSVALGANMRGLISASVRLRKYGHARSSL